MKKTAIFGIVITSILLSSCSLLNMYETEEKEVNVYALDMVVDNPRKTLEEDASKGTISPRFIKGEKYIPYLSLEQYASLYKPFYAENVENVIDSSTTSATWTIKKDGEPCFIAMISPYTKSVMVAGSLSSAFASTSNPNNYSALEYQAKFATQQKRLNEDTNYATYSFKNCSFKSFRNGGDLYYPLGFYDNAFSGESGVYFLYSYKNIYSTWNVDNYALKFKHSNGQFESVNEEMESMTQGEKIPSYLINYNAYIFLFVMENFYGLKSTLGISSMKSYYVNHHLYDGLFSSNGETRGDAYSRALAVFDDNHTGLVSANNAWGEGKAKPYGAEGVMKRQALRKTLTEKRSAYYTSYFGHEEASWGSNITSISKKTAMFHFDEFNIGPADQVFNPDGTITSDAFMYDTYLNIYSKLDALKKYQNGIVENVIIDVSLNGGGTIGVMGKLLALISKDNKAPFYMYSSPDSILVSTVVSVDSNNDGKYDAEDCFGDDFNIYIMTSDCSFSCGNAFPYFAQKMGIKTIGETSGGGECSVSIHYMPNSEYVYHSGTTHLGYYDESTKAFTGNEGGAKPDIPLIANGKSSLAEYKGNEIVYNIPSNFYDIEYLESVITR